MSTKLSEVATISSVSLANIPGKLRQLADEMEIENAAPVTLVWVQQHDDGEITIGAFGDNPSKNEVVGMLVLASRLFTPESGYVKRGGSHKG